MIKEEEKQKKFLDVVCNSYVGADEDRVEYKGKFYYFCCKGCKDLFQQNPEKYVLKESIEAHGEKVNNKLF